MYYLIGLPGWTRFGYSPGWIDRSPKGLSPTAEWVMSNGLMPQFREYLRIRHASPTPSFQPIGTSISKEEEIRMLEERSKVIESNLDSIKKRLEEFKKSSTTQPHSPYGYLPTPYTMPSPEEELASLEDYRRYLEEEVRSVEARIEELKRLQEEKSST